MTCDFPQEQAGPAPNSSRMDRRSFLRTGAVATAAAVSMGADFWRRTFADHVPPVPGEGPYGPLGTPDANGVRVPAGFTCRVLGTTGEPLAGTSFPWIPNPDGGATFATPDGGWIYVSNSEVPVIGGAAAIRFAADGSITDAYRILTGTSINCAGGPTPWGTWLSCEEHEAGLVWECDPTGRAPAVPRPALGTFKHEAAAVDPSDSRVYLTEDQGDGRFYRFTPVRPGDLSEGLLEVAEMAPNGAVTWHPIPLPNAVRPATRQQVPTSTVFDRGEGAWFDAASNVAYFCTTGNHRVWGYHVDTQTIELIFDGRNTPGSPLRGADNITVSRSGDIFVCEDGGNLEIVMITPEGAVAPVMQVTGQTGTEITGVAFDPSGTRMYFSSQRAIREGWGKTYEVSGPFRQTAG